MHSLAPPTVPALRDARSATQGQRQGFFIHEQRFVGGRKFAARAERADGSR